MLNGDFVTIGTRLLAALSVGAVALATPTATAAPLRDGRWQMDGDRGDELAVVLSTYGGPQLVVIPGSTKGAKPEAARLVEASDLGVEGRLGLATAGDVNGDGYADFVTTAMAPSSAEEASRGAVVVVPGRDGDFDAANATVLPNPQSRSGLGGQVVMDVNRDGYDDVVVQGRKRRDAHFLMILWGAETGLSTQRRTVHALPGVWAKGAGMEHGNLDGDPAPELVLLRPGRTRDVDETRATRGRMAVCDITAGSLRCGVDRRVAPGNTDIVVADVAGGGVDDVVLGQPRTVYGYEWETNRSRLWVYRGTPDGLDPHRTMVSQDSPGVPGSASWDDLFGEAVAAGDLDGDGKDDVVVGATGEAAGGAVTLLYGHRGGLGRSSRDRVLSQSTRGVPGADEPTDDFGADVTFVDVDGNDRLDLVVSTPGEDNGPGADHGAITVIRSDADTTLRPALSQQIEPSDVGISPADPQRGQFPWFGEALPR